MEKILYELTPSQDVVRLQCKYTLFKRVVNIISSMTTQEPFDFEILRQALNLTIERNDCLRLRFIKKNKKLMQYFVPKHSFETVPTLEFKTEQEQLAFINSLRKKAIKYKKGIVIEPYFIKTFDNKFMILLKVCHLILDIIYKDLFDIYYSLTNKTSLPPAPTKYEDVVIKDLETKAKEYSRAKDYDFFKNILENNPEPNYAGIQSKDEPIWKKLLNKNKKPMKMFFINNDTKGYALTIDKNTVKKVEEFSKNVNISIPNIYFYISSLCSAITNNVTNILPLELSNCRGSALEKNCAGTKVQSVGCYTKIDYSKSFIESLNEFNAYNFSLFRHLSFPDQDFEMLLHKTYKSSMLTTYYHLTFSFIPYSKPDNFEFNMYSNEKCALPAYVALMYDINNKDITINYDVQTKIITQQDVDKFHNTYVNIINQVIDNPDILIKDIMI